MLKKLIDDNSIEIDALAKKSKVSEEKIRGYMAEPNSMTLLDACKLGIGFKKLGIYADEHTLLGDRHARLFEECFDRSITEPDNEEDKEYWKLQKTIITGIDITRRRVSMGLSRQKLADKVGIDVRSIEKYETGERLIDNAEVITVYQLAKGLNCRMEDIIRKDRLD